jgi:spore germination protein
MRNRSTWWALSGTLAILALAAWGVWTWRLTAANRDLALTVEADRQRNFSDMAYHVEQIQSLLGKGLVAGTTRQNMRYLSEAYHHAQAASTAFTSLPLPAEVSASVGKFLQQTGDFASSVARNEAAGRELDAQGRAELARLRMESAALSTQLQDISAGYNQGGFRWSPPIRFSWAGLLRGNTGAMGGAGGGVGGKPNTQDQAPASMVPGGWDLVGTSMEQLPVMIYDGPFSDHLADRAPAVQAAPVDRTEAERQMRRQVPGADTARVVGVEEVSGNLPTYSFRLAPAATNGGAYTAVADVARNGGFLVQWLNSREIGEATLDLERARTLGIQYLASIGLADMTPTYGQIQDGIATIAFAYKQNNVVVYPDQVKLKVALDNGEVLGVDARQYLMAHHPRDLRPATITPDQAQKVVRPDLRVERTQLALIPNQAGSGEILTYEFLARMGEEVFLIYVNANTGQEEQILQQIQNDGGTFAL